MFELPGARKKRENSPQNPRKIRGFGWETSVFARFGYVLGVKNVAERKRDVPSWNLVKYKIVRVFVDFSCFWGFLGRPGREGGPPGGPRQRGASEG